MTDVGFSTSFQRAFKRKIKGNALLETRFWERLEIFQNNPFDQRLRTHKLSGRLKDLWSFTIEYDLRVVFYSWKVIAPYLSTSVRMRKSINHYSAFKLIDT